MTNKSTIGLICIFGWCLFSALARITTSHVSQHIDPVILCFYSFALSTIVFLLLNFKNVRSTFAKLSVQKNKNNFFWLNVTTFGAWFFLILPLKYIEPSIVSTITLGLSPIATVLLGGLIYQNRSVNPFDIVISVLLFFVILYTISLCFSGVATLSKISTANLLLIIGCCFIVGFASAGGNLFAKKLSDNQFSPAEILSSRFLLTVLLSGIILLVRDGSLFIPFYYFADIALTAAFLVIIPLYLAQVSIKYLEPITVAIAVPLMPVLVIIFESLDHHRPLPTASIMVTLITTLLVLGGVFIQYRKMKRAQYNAPPSK